MCQHLGEERYAQVRSGRLWRSCFAGWEERPVSFLVGSELSKPQQKVTEHLANAAAVFLSWGEPVPDMVALRRDLKIKKIGYGGEEITRLRQVTASKVLPAWPSAEAAAKVPILGLLEGELWEDLADPRRCLRPVEEWPDEPPQSRVHASDEEWYQIVGEGLRRGILGECPKHKIFTDHRGKPVLNGCMGVDKCKVIDG